MFVTFTKRNILTTNTPRNSTGILTTNQSLNVGQLSSIIDSYGSLKAFADALSDKVHKREQQIEEQISDENYTHNSKSNLKFKPKSQIICKLSLTGDVWWKEI